MLAICREIDESLLVSSSAAVDATMSTTARLEGMDDVRSVSVIFSAHYYCYCHHVNGKCRKKDMGDVLINERHHLSVCGVKKK